MKLMQRTLILLVGFLLAQSTFAQDDMATVPDLIGLNVPQAAAALNREGLALGVQSDVEWSEASGLPENTVSDQSVVPGVEAAPGTVVDITVLRAANVILIYDDNDLSFINHSGMTINLNTVVFRADNGPAFNANQWRGNLEHGECGQIWSISRNEAKNLPECRSMYWRTTNNTNQHFWTQVNGVNNFTVEVGGVIQATCDAAPANSQDSPTSCQFFIAGGTVTDLTEYIYFAYSTEAFTIINQSDDRWMPTVDTNVYNPVGAPFQLGNPAFFAESSPVADLTNLAPAQCLLFTVGAAEEATLPVDCDVIAQSGSHGSDAFWLVDFEIRSGTDLQRHNCPAATEGKVTLCIMPR